MNHWGLTIHSMSPWLSILNSSQIKGRILRPESTLRLCLWDDRPRPGKLREIELQIIGWLLNGVMKCEFIVVKCRQIQLKMILYMFYWGWEKFFLHQMIEVRFASSYQHIKVWTSQRPSGGRNFTTYTPHRSERLSGDPSLSRHPRT